jgi:serine/threonine protein phosphatase 1
MKQIKLEPTDTLYILGDVVDRYKYGIKILMLIKKMPNVKMLLGNHEYMMLEALDSNNISTSKLYQWYRNGGECTHEYLKHIRKETRRAIFDYLKALPLNYEIEVGGKQYKLVHASPIENFHTYGKGHYDNVREFAVWERWNERHRVPSGFTLVFGHTPTCYFQQGEPIRIWRGDDAIGIDCACGYYDGRLGCLRLDDMQEFYSLGEYPL